MTSIEVHPDVTGLLWEYGFSDLRDLRTVKLPASLVTIAPNMFYFCTGLESLELDPENPSYTVEDDVLFNKEKTQLIQYPLGKKDTTYAAPDGVEVIGAKAFCELQYLEELTLPDTVRTIERQVFEEAKSLRKVDLGNSVEFIDECAFFRADNIGGKDIGGKSIMNIMAACMKCGSEITVTCNGADEEAMLNEAASLIESGFGEE